MRIFNLFLLFASVTPVACNKAPNSTLTANPVYLHLDNAHNQAAGTNAEPYVIEPCKTVNVDTTGYSIPLPRQFPDSGPNALHLIHGNEEYFRAAWDGKSHATLDTTTLKNIRGHSGFSGFRAGETYILGVGHDNFPAPEMKFNVAWAALIKV